jgi:PhnB protein
VNNIPAAPEGSNTVNPFIMADSAAALIEFIVEVFGATDVTEARTLDTDGLILHSELRLGDSTLTVADRKPDWPFTPAFTRVYVDDVEATLARAEQHGGTVVTKPTDFFGDTLSRFADPSGNLWWVYRHVPAPAWNGEAEADAADWSESGGDDDWSSFTSPELEYIHNTLMDAMGSLSDPRG